jgi:5-methylthioadenosine/S-adenosylhomocysteine deaminase
VSHLVYATKGDDVQSVVVNGKVLMRGRRVQTLDEPAILAEARAIAEKVKLAVKP